MAVLRLLALLGVLAAPLPAVPGEDALEPLRRMAEAVRNLNYEGTFVYAHSGLLETMKIVHQNDGDSEVEHLFSLDGNRRELVRDRDDAVCIYGDAKPILLDRAAAGAAFPGKPNGDLARLRLHYRLALGETVRVAGRETRQLAIHPNDDLRYGYRLWLDQVTGLPLKSELVGAEGKVLEQILFTELRVFDQVSRELWRQILARKAWARRAIVEAGTQDTVTTGRWQVARLPAGFELSGRRSYPTPGRSEPVEHLVFSDGLATVSVYVEAVDGSESMNGVARMGGVSTYASQVEGHQVVVVGDVPMKTVHAIGAAVHRLDGTSGQ